MAAVGGLTAYALENVKQAPAREAEENEETVYTVPVVFQPTDVEFDDCTILDSNGDGTTWRLGTKDQKNAFFYEYNGSNDADDWCFLPPVHMMPGVYKVAYSYACRGMAENFRVFFGQGTDPNDYDNMLLEQEGYSAGAWATEFNEVEVSEEGDYRVALYAYSIKDKYGIYFRDITITKIDARTPSQPTATVESTGMEGVITVNLPTTNIGDEELTGTIGATVTRDDEELPFATITGNPGESIEVAVTVSTRGEHVFTLRSFVEIEGETLYSEPTEVEHLFTRVMPEPLPLGYTIAPDEDDFAACMVLDANEDNRSWDLYGAGLPTGGEASKAFRYNSGYSGGSNDWLVLPAFEGVETGVGLFSFLFGTKSMKENLEMAVSLTPDIESLEQNIVWSLDEYCTYDKFVRQDAYFPAPAETFYIAFHIHSEGATGTAFLQDLTLNASSDNVPLVPEFGEAEFNGGNGTVQLILPELNVANQTMEGTIYAEVTIDGEPYGQEVSGNPGETIILGFEDLAMGEHEVTASAYRIVDEERYASREVSTSFRVKMPADYCYEIPANIVFTQDMLDACVVENVNDDNRTWEFYPSGDCFRYTYTDDNDADDWLITPAINFPIANVEYDIQVALKANSSMWPERVEIFIGETQSAAGMNIQVMDTTVIANNSSFEDYGNKIVVPATGKYYVGIHCISEKGQYNLFCQKVTVTSPSVGVGATKSINGSVAGLRGAIRLSGFAGEQVSIYTMGGHVIQALKAEDTDMVPVPAGMYLVRVGDRTYKVVVK